jgi:hypothetical protein
MQFIKVFVFLSLLKPFSVLSSHHVDAISRGFGGPS